jgi:hypothetical protein
MAQVEIRLAEVPCLSTVTMQTAVIPPGSFVFRCTVAYFSEVKFSFRGCGKIQNVQLIVTLIDKWF